jgi:membrane-anchored mycosin MYCP
MAILKGRVERYHDDQMIVALPNLTQVQRVLGEFGVEQGRTTPDERLGLALLALPRLGEDIVRLRQDPERAQAVQSATAVWRADVDAGIRVGEIPGIDLLMLMLRAYFREKFDGWTPTVGKNHVVEHPGLEGFPHVRGGAEDPPEPAIVEWPRRNAVPDADVRVGLLDTKLWEHPWLAGGYMAAPHTLFGPAAAYGGDGSGPWPATAGHATFIAGLILHRAQSAVLQVWPVLDVESHGDVWTAATRIADLTTSPVDVLNLSFGCFTDDGRPPLALATAVGLVSPQTVVVAAAGNYGPADLIEGLTTHTPMWPAALDDVIAVGASDHNGKPAPFSPDLPWMAFRAPGVHVESTYLTGKVAVESASTQGRHAASADDARIVPFKGWACWSGTSFAAAAMTGAIAARIKPGHRSAREAMDMLRKPRQDGADHDVIPLS